MYIKIQLSWGREITVSVSPHETVEILKHNIQEISGIPANRQQLRYNRCLLNNKEKLDSYQIWNNDVLFLTVLSCKRHSYTIDEFENYNSDAYLENLIFNDNFVHEPQLKRQRVEQKQENSKTKSAKLLNDDYYEF